MNSGSLRLISGVGAKAPACFLLETAGKRLLLDLGEGPPPGHLPDVAGVGPVDAVIFSHGHKDHVGGLSLLAKLGDPPVYATQPVARALPPSLAARPLPVGCSEFTGPGWPDGAGSSSWRVFPPCSSGSSPSFI